MNHGADDSLCLELVDDAATRALGAAMAQVLVPGLSLWLRGDLGAGKTTLVRGLLRALHYAGRVKSPTYTLVELYSFSSFNLYHFDLYRFGHPEEWEDAGFREYFNADSVCLVEWPDKAADYLPAPDLVIELELRDEGRLARLTGMTETGRKCVTSCMARFALGG